MKPPVAISVRQLVFWVLVVSSFDYISECMLGLQACLFVYITVTAFCSYAQHGDDAANRVGWRPYIE